MGVYNRNNDIFNEGSIDLEVGIQETQYDDILEANFAMLAESEQNYNAIMQAVGIAEVSHFAETGEELVYEASNVSGLFSKAKEFFRSLLEKIKGIFRKFFSMFDTYTKSDKEFINKYRNHLLKINTRDFKYKGFNFDSGKIADTHGGSAATAMKKHIASISGDIVRIVADVKTGEVTTHDAFIKTTESIEDVVEELRGKAIGQSSMTASELNKELFELYRSGESTKEELDAISVADLLGVISNAAKIKKDAEKAFREIEKEINEDIKKMDKAEKDLVKAIPYDTKGASISKAITASSRSIQLNKAKLTIAQTVNAAMLTAMKDHNRQSKAICVALMNYKPKNEGANFGDDDYVAEGGFLGNVVMR